MSCHVGSGKQISVLCMSSECFLPLSHLSSSLCPPFLIKDLTSLICYIVQAMTSSFLYIPSTYSKHAPPWLALHEFPREMMRCCSQILRGSDPFLPLAPQAAQRKLRQASTNVKHWNVQMNRLMRPIEPGGEPSLLGVEKGSFQVSRATKVEESQRAPLSQG